MKYDYLVVGSGLFGSIFAHEMAKKGKRIKVIEKRKHVAGNIYTNVIEGINVHQYGAHIFHTDNLKIWSYINQFVTFNRFTNAPIANYKGEMYNLPFNMNTFNKLWGVATPGEAKKKIEEQRAILNGKKPENLEEQAISLVGTDIYTKLIKGYTEKQWGRKCIDLPAFIIKRLPVRYTYDNNYFKDRYQGIPIGGYTQIIEKMLNHSAIEVTLDTDYFSNKEYYDSLGKKIVFTGMLDQYFNYQYGELEYRSVTFISEVLPMKNYKGNAVINYTDKETKYTRIIEHKHFEFGKQEKTIITKEFPKEWTKEEEPYYPINDKKNMTILKKYFELATAQKKVIFGGRLGTYQYLDMHMIIKEALKTVESELQQKE